MKLDEVVVHMEYKLQLYKVSSKSDEDYESFLNGPLFNGWILDAGEFGVKGAKRSFIVHHKSKIILLSLFLAARSRWSLLCTLNNYVYRRKRNAERYVAKSFINSIRRNVIKVYLFVQWFVLKTEILQLKLLKLNWAIFSLLRYVFKYW